MIPHFEELMAIGALALVGLTIWLVSSVWGMGVDEEDEE